MKDNHSNKNEPEDQKSYGGYYNGYGSYSYGYGSGAYEENNQRNIKDYLLILRERVWLLVFVFAIIFLGSIIYLIKATPIYEAEAMLQILRDDTTVLGVRSVESNEVRTSEDLNTQIKVLESSTLAKAVADRLQKENLTDVFLAPYSVSNKSKEAIAEILFHNRKIVPERSSLMIMLAYNHPDPEIAAKVANMFAEEYINYNMTLNIDGSMKAIFDLKERAKEQQKVVENIETQMAEYREKYGTVSLEQQADIDHQELTEINKTVTDARRDFDIAQSRKNLVDQYIKSGGKLWDLSFINSIPQVEQLLSDLATKNIEISSLEKRYGAKHPKMIEATRAKEQTEIELKSALDSSINKVYANYDHARDFLIQSEKRLAQKEKGIINLSKIKVEYSTLSRDFEVNQGLYQSMVLRLNTEMAQIDLKKPSARIIDFAVAPGHPAKPKKVIILALGLMGGIASGLGAVFAIAFFDDRIKTAFDIESVVGLPLLGVIPRMANLNTQEKAKTVVKGTEKTVLESFRAIDSLLRLNKASKPARVITVTSTLPSEGKSFFTTNLGLTFAANDEKVLIIDADLRMPSIGSSLQLDKKKGILQYCEEGASLDDIVNKNVYSNFDVITAGGKATNPTQIFLSPRFQQLLEEAKSRYSKIIIDTPPLGVVSDIMNILPYTDGLIFVVKFNSVKRKTAKAHLSRLLESNVPVFGAVINQISLDIVNYYYSNYYDKTYYDYYNNGELPEKKSNLDKATKLATRVKSALSKKKNKEKTLV